MFTFTKPAWHVLTVVIARIVFFSPYYITIQGLYCNALLSFLNNPSKPPRQIIFYYLLTLCLASITYTLTFINLALVVNWFIILLIFLSILTCLTFSVKRNKIRQHVLTPNTPFSLARVSIFSTRTYNVHTCTSIRKDKQALTFISLPF